MTLTMYIVAVWWFFISLWGARVNLEVGGYETHRKARFAFMFAVYFGCFWGGLFLMGVLQ